MDYLSSASGAGSQVVLDAIEPVKEPTLRGDSTLLPVYAAGASLAALLLKAFWAWAFGTKTEAAVGHGGAVIYAHKLVRAAANGTLLGLAIATTVIGYDGQGLHSLRGLQQLAWCITFGYATVLAVIAVTVSTQLGRAATTHLVCVNLAAWGVYVYRDAWPLLTLTLEPLDRAEGHLLWAKAAVLTLAAVVIPLVIPRQYIPVDPLDPVEPCAEQTKSLLSMMSFTFMDDIIFKGYRATEQLQLDQLPPLADYDSTKNLRARTFPILDCFSGAHGGHKPSHVMVGLLQIFRWDYTICALALIVHVLAEFSRPVGVNQLLAYLETKGEGATVRVWVWILLLLVGPIISSLAAQWYGFVMVRTYVQTESIITQLVFSHALRIRLKADDPKPAPAKTPSEEDTGSEDDDTTLQASTASVKTEATVTSKPDGPPSANLIGKLNNLVTTDLAKVGGFRMFIFLIVMIPLQVVLAAVFLYSVLGWASFVGMAVMAVLVPVPGYIAKLSHSVQENQMKQTDARVQVVTELTGVLRMVKLFGWERSMAERVGDAREEELKWIRKGKVLQVLSEIVNTVIPVVTMLATYVTYTLIMKEELTASRVFSSINVFGMLRGQLVLGFHVLNVVIQGKVSLDRVDEFLKSTELLDHFDAATSFECRAPEGDDIIGFHDASFTWSAGDDTSSSSSSPKSFRLQIEGDLLFKQGNINLVLGPTGSGKTSLLMALLGEMHFDAEHSQSWFKLPRAGGVAYAAQESWVLSQTIRENILFGSEYDEERYKKVISQCALERDLALFEAGDATEVGEKGLTLSGGQKARITLARAVYSKAKILLLDDIFAALDVHTSRSIVDNCLSGDLIQGRTVILVTHNIAMTSEIADFVVSLGTDGRIATQGTISDALEKNKTLAAEVKAEQELAEREEDKIDNTEELAPPAENKPAADGKLVVEEEVKMGHVGWPALKLFFAALGGNAPLLFWLSFLGFLLLAETAEIMQTRWLGWWGQQYETHHASEVPVPYYVGVYSAILAVNLIGAAAAFLAFLFGSIRASRWMHRQLMNSILGATLRWLDITPTSRILTRVTQDINTVDDAVALQFQELVRISAGMALKLLTVVLATPFFLLPGIVIFILGGVFGELYIKSQLPVKRTMSNSKAPVLAQFGSAVAGLTSVRAYGAQGMVTRDVSSSIDRYTRAARCFWNLNRWIGLRIDGLGSVFSASLAWYLVYWQSNPKASDTGFTLNMAVGFSSMILYWVRILNEFEVSGNSLERIKGYLEIEQEPRATESGKPPASWPTSGSIKVENLSSRYSADGPEVLHNLNFEVRSGERIGVVGRTGSGKSSLTLSLLRCILTEGTVLYDGIPTSSINLDALRKSITIIPQVPELLAGTLRRNLDPFDAHSDADLNDALRSAGLSALQEDMDDGKITLDTVVSSGGGNLSVGQRQILALARAIIRRSKLLILDEATSAIDYKTDAVIQRSLRHELPSDVTFITVAHRLQTIMDADRIMVLDAGRIVEFDTPRELLGQKDGFLRSLVDESSDKKELYAMVKDQD